MAQRITRRKLLKGAGVLGAAFLTSCQSKGQVFTLHPAATTGAPTNPPRETDVPLDTVPPTVQQPPPDSPTPSGIEESPAVASTRRPRVTATPEPSPGTEVASVTDASPTKGPPRATITQRPTETPYVPGPFQSDRLNFITIVCDTWRYDHIGFHGNKWIQTPNLDAFADQSQVFDRAYAGGFPTVLNRAELLTGRHMYPRMGWEDMPEGEVVLAQALNDAGYTTGLVFDTMHFKDHGFSLDRAFQAWEWVRGQEGDRYRANPLHPPLPAHPSKFRHEEATVSQYLRNQADREDEGDYMVARTVQAAIAWLRRNYDQNSFYLHIDSFDPHEPWDPPQSYVDLYNPGYTGQQVIYPLYAPADYLAADELEHVKALYAAEITMVDHWLGVLLAEIDALGLTDNTVVIFTSDHGILLGEHGGIGKAWDHGGHYETYPLYEELIHIPLMIRVPGKVPRRIQALAQPVDLMPTVLELAGAASPETMQGVSLVPAVEDNAGSVAYSTRKAMISARSLKLRLSFKPRITVSDGEWTLLHGAAHAGSELYYLPEDPRQETNLITRQCSVAYDLHAHLISTLDGIDVPPSIVSQWRSRPC